jgi:hypothetical protein
VDEKAVWLTFDRHMHRLDAEGDVLGLTQHLRRINPALSDPLFPTFVITLRGYDRHQVEAHLDALRAARERHAPDPPAPAFDVVFRGYHRTAVDARLVGLAA